MKRADKILGLLKTSKSNFKQNEENNKNRECHKFRKKTYDTTADILCLFDEGKWLEFQERIDENFKQIRNLKESNEPSLQNYGDNLNAPLDKSSGGKGTESNMDHLPKFHSEELLPESHSEDLHELHLDKTRPLNDSLQSCSKYLEMTLEELNGTPVDNLINLLDTYDVPNHTSPSGFNDLPHSAIFEPTLDEQSKSEVEMTGLPDDSQINHTSPSGFNDLPHSAIFEPTLDEQSKSEVEMTGLPDDSQINHTSPSGFNDLPHSVIFEPTLDEQSKSEVEMTGLPDDSQINHTSPSGFNDLPHSVIFEPTLDEQSKSEVEMTGLPDDSQINHTSPSGFNDLPHSAIFEPTLDEQSKSEVEMTGLPDDSHIEYEKPNPEINSKERKKNVCPFCDPIKLICCSNYWRHLLRNHSENVDVIRMNSLPKGSPGRRAILTEIRNRGNFLYNSANDNYFVPSKRPLKEQSPKKNNYVSCMHCLVFVKRKNFFLHRKSCAKFEGNLTECKHCKVKLPEGHLSKHLKTCNKTETFHVKDVTSNKPKRQNRVLLNSSLFVSQNLVGASDDLCKNVLPILRIDEISEIIKGDSLILKVGSKLRSNHKENHSIHDIITKMRPLAQILRHMRKMNAQIRTFQDCLKCQHVQLLFQAVQQISGYDESTGSVKVPSMPGRIKGPLSLALQILQNDTRCDPNLSYDTKKELLFIYKTTENVIHTDWRFVISTNAQKSLNEKHRNKGILLPLEDDIKTASEYLSKKEESLLKQIQEKVDPVTYDNLCEAVIADIIIFNCRRAGEVARAGIKHYLGRSHIEYEGDLKAVLSESELKAKDSLTMFYVPGKRDRSVPILLTNTMKRCVDMIVALRSQMGVSNNPLLFPRLYSDRPFDSCRIIRELKNKLPLKKPEHFTSTGFRHEIATSSHHQDAERSGYKRVLFSHMGHTEAVHNEKYVTPLPILQITKVGSNLLKRRSRTGMDGSKSLHNTEGKTTSPDRTCNLTQIENFSNYRDPDFLPSHHIDNSSNSSNNEDDFVPKNKRKKLHIPWTVQQQECVIRYFKDYFISKSTPGKKMCENLISVEDCLKDRTWQQIKAFIENVNKKRRKLLPQLKSKYLLTD